MPIQPHSNYLSTMDRYTTTGDVLKLGIIDPELEAVSGTEYLGML